MLEAFLAVLDPVSGSFISSFTFLPQPRPARTQGQAEASSSPISWRTPRAPSPGLETRLGAFSQMRLAE